MVKLIRYPKQEDWAEVKRRAFVTIGKTSFELPDEKWMKAILMARHSPIRYLQFSFYIECPYWVSVHLCRHIHAQPYVKSQRNDRQNEYERNSARQDAPVMMIWDMNAEELMVIMNKRLCNLASRETREIVEQMREQVLLHRPEFSGLLVPMCEYAGCHEMMPCGKREKNKQCAVAE